MRKKINYIAYLSLLVWVTVCVFSVLPKAMAGSPSIAVIYPDIREPYRSVFQNIIRGIKDEIYGPVKEYALEEDYSSLALRNWLKRERISLVIALGTRGLMAAKELPATLRIVIGAVLIAPDQKVNGFEVVTLTPDPEMLFERLKALVPRVKQVTIVYDREHGDWLIKRARKMAGRYGLELNALPAETLREAATLYRDLLDKQSGTSNAIWLPQDPTTVDDQTILPLILRKAWDRNLVVFSSNPAHVSKGVLFSMYPDNLGMGRSLAAIALNQESNSKNDSSTIRPLQDLLVAVNLRTAEHLGLKLTGREKREFDLIFPSP